MKAIVQPRYGAPRDVLRLEHVDDPVPGENGVLIRMHAAGVNAYDWHMVTGEPRVMRLAGPALRAPAQRVAGRDVAGVVEAVGTDVTRFRAGDEVFGACDGSFAEFGLATEEGVVHKPAEVSFEHAAAVPMAALTALQGLRDHGAVQPGQHVAITGASGGVGTFAVQIAKVLGAEVTAVCSTHNVELVRGIGADHVVDYTREDLTRRGERYDLIFDLAGRPPLAGCRRSLTPDGVLISCSGEGGGWLGPLPRIARGVATFAPRRQRFVMFVAKESRDDLTYIAGLLTSGQIRSVIDRTFPLADAPAAVDHLYEGHTQGKVVVTR